MTKPITQYVTISTPRDALREGPPKPSIGCDFSKLEERVLASLGSKVSNEEDTKRAYAFFGVAPPPSLLARAIEADKAEQHSVNYYEQIKSVQGGKSVVIDELLKGFDAQLAAKPSVYVLSHRAQASQFLGRATRKHPQFDQIPRKSKAQRKLDAAAHELKKIKANFEMEAGFAYRSFLAGIVQNPGLCTVATNLQPSHIGRSWYKELLADLGYAPYQLRLPMPEAK